MGRRRRQRKRRAARSRWSLAEALSNTLLARNIIPLHMVQIGANLGDFDRSNHLALSQDPVRVAVHAMLVSVATRAILIEANPPVFSHLNASVRRFFNGSTRVSAVNALLCSREASEPINFYRVNVEKLEREFPDRRLPNWARTELNSMNFRSVEWGVKAAIVGHRTNHASFEALPYIETLRLPCVGPRTLLRNAAIEPSTLDVLVVDAEGFDVCDTHQRGCISMISSGFAKRDRRVSCTGNHRRGLP